MICERCKCGKVEVWSSGMPAKRCSPCKECGTVPAIAPDMHPESIPHEFSLAEQVQTDEGEKTLTRCRYCYRTPAEIEKANLR